MEIEIKIDQTCKETKVIVVTDAVTDEINALLRRITEEPQNAITGVREGILEILEPADIYRIFAENGKVFAEAKGGNYQLRQRLYELEQRLDSRRFVRISNSEIVNLKMVKGFDLSFTGTICVMLANGTATYVSRRYVAKIKQVLGI